MASEYHLKRLGALRELLCGHDYRIASEALEFARGYHGGLRKDGITPEFDHQVKISLYLLTLRDVQDMEAVVAAALLHDVTEDYAVPQETLAGHFGSEVADAVWLMSKKYRGRPVHGERYFAQIAACPIASLVKGCDRIHNVQTMAGVFTEEKQRCYLTEVRADFLPMLKSARKRYPEQRAAYANVEHVLSSQHDLLACALGVPTLGAVREEAPGQAPHP